MDITFNPEVNDVIAAHIVGCVISKLLEIFYGQSELNHRYYRHTCMLRMSIICMSIISMTQPTLVISLWGTKVSGEDQEI